MINFLTSTTRDSLSLVGGRGLPTPAHFFPASSRNVAPPFRRELPLAAVVAVLDDCDCDSLSITAVAVLVEASFLLITRLKDTSYV